MVLYVNHLDSEMVPRFGDLRHPGQQDYSFSIPDKSCTGQKTQNLPDLPPPSKKKKERKKKKTSSPHRLFRRRLAADKTLHSLT